MMASLGLPGLNGFVGEFLILSGTFLTHRWWAVVATIGVVISAMYLLWAYQQAFHHRPDEANAKTRDLNWREGLVMVPLVGLIIFLGVYPKPVLDRITPTVSALVNRVDSANGKHQPVPGSTAGSPTGYSAIGHDSHGSKAPGASSIAAVDPSVGPAVDPSVGPLVGQLSGFHGATGLGYALGVSVHEMALDSHVAAASFERGMRVSASHGAVPDFRGEGLR
jgi:hypothetical protein